MAEGHGEAQQSGGEAVTDRHPDATLKVAGGWRKGGYVTIRNETIRDIRSASTKRAARPPSEEGARGASLVVQAYVRVRTCKGLFTARPYRAILGAQAKRLLSSGRWDVPTLVSAVEVFAHTKRHPRFLEEWASEVLTRAELAEHEARKVEEKTQTNVDRPMRRLDFSAFIADVQR